jgi:hypothetical protein
MRRAVNIKNSLVTMARHLEDLFLRQTRLTCDTLNSMINAIGFCRQKTHRLLSTKNTPRQEVPEGFDETCWKMAFIQCLVDSTNQAGYRIRSTRPFF